MREGSALDRSISFVSILTTSVPEFASATFLVALFVFKLGWLPGTSAMTGGFNPVELVLPVAVLVLYDFGYVARMTRASMAEVMTSQYIRTAVLKGLPHQTRDHGPRPAQRADRAVHGDRAAAQLAALGRDRGRGVLRLRGFGKLLYDAATFGDIYLIEACTLVAVFVAVFSQFISDVGYTLLNPRIRFS